MSSRILVNPQTPQGAALIDAADKVIAAQEAINRVKGAIDRMTTGSPADYAAVQAELGLGTTQEATDLVFLLSSATTALNAAIITEFAQRTEQG